MQGVRGQNKAPGEFRKTQNWIGGDKLTNAHFVPPEPQLVLDLMSDLETFVHNEEIQVPHLIRIALIHYQFETIHPFLDGNGRTGRLLITLYLIANSILKYPTLYLSDYLEKNRIAYFDALDRTRKNNDVIGWVKFLLQGVIETSERGCAVFQTIIDLKSEIDAIADHAGARSGTIRKFFNYLFERPVIRLTNKVSIEGISNKTIRRLVDQFEKEGLLKEISGRQRDRVFVFEKYLRLFE